MVFYDINTESGHQLIESAGGIAFEGSVGSTGASDTVNYVAALVIFFNELVDGINVVLEVGIERNSHIAAVFSIGKTGEEGVLMTSVTGKLESFKKLGGLEEGGDDLPSFILTSVVYEKDTAFGRYGSLRDESLKLFKHLFRRLGESLLFVVAGNH